MDKLFTNKRTYKNSKEEEMLDMCIPSLPIERASAHAVLKLNSEHNGRLDRFVYTCVSKNIDDGLDRTMYINHIFNPFAVQEGDILYVPNCDGDIYQKVVEPSLPDDETLSNKVSTTKQMTYAQRIEYLAKMGLGVK